MQLYILLYVAAFVAMFIGLYLWRVAKNEDNKELGRALTLISIVWIIAILIKSNAS